MTSQTDKNIAMAKECGAGIVYLGDTVFHIDMQPNQLDEYTSRACAELERKMLEQQAMFHVNMLRAWPGKSHDEIANAIKSIGGSAELDKLVAEKDALIAMQAEALQFCQNNLTKSFINFRIVDEALAATAETVEAWKNSNIVGLTKAAWYDGYTEREQELRGDKK